jgi:hypothetical protein
LNKSLRNQSQRWTMKETCTENSEKQLTWHLSHDGILQTKMLEKSSRVEINISKINNLHNNISKIYQVELYKAWKTFPATPP